MRMLTTFMAAALAAGVSAAELPRETPAVAPDVSSWHGVNLLGLFNAAPQKPDKRIRGKYEDFEGHKLDRKMLDLLRKYVH